MNLLEILWTIRRLRLDWESKTNLLPNFKNENGNQNLQELYVITFSPEHLNAGPAVEFPSHLTSVSPIITTSLTYPTSVTLAASPPTPVWMSFIRCAASQ